MLNTINNINIENINMEKASFLWRQNNALHDKNNINK